MKENVCMHHNSIGDYLCHDEDVDKLLYTKPLHV